MQYLTVLKDFKCQARYQHFVPLRSGVKEKLSNPPQAENEAWQHQVPGAMLEGPFWRTWRSLRCKVRPRGQGAGIPTDAYKTFIQNKTLL